jgi:putative ABC transport system ATP-binding protein
MPTSALTIKDLSFTYRTSDASFTLRLPSLELAPAQQMLLTGPSGSGKSTLLALVAGLIDCAAGSITIAGTSIQALRGPARDRFRGQHIGMIFQTFNLVPEMTAIENIELALMFSTLPPAEHRSRATTLLDALGVPVSRRPVDRLSVGQQQRVAIARAVACKPALVLADEPTASLDPDNAAAAMTLIQAACKDNQAALLCVSHDPAMSSRFQHIAHLPALTASV